MKIYQRGINTAIYIYWLIIHNISSYSIRYIRLYNYKVTANSTSDVDSFLKLFNDFLLPNLKNFKLTLEGIVDTAFYLMLALASTQRLSTIDFINTITEMAVDHYYCNT